MTSSLCLARMGAEALDPWIWQRRPASPAARALRRFQTGARSAPAPAAGLDWVIAAGAICEGQGHHAEFTLGWGHAEAVIYAHKGEWTHPGRCGAGSEVQPDRLRRWLITGQPLERQRTNCCQPACAPPLRALWEALWRHCCCSVLSCCSCCSAGFGVNHLLHGDSPHAQPQRLNRTSSGRDNPRRPYNRSRSRT